MPLADVAELYAQIPEAVAAATGARCHVGAVVDAGAYLDGVPHLRAYFSPARRTVFVSPRVTAGFTKHVNASRETKVAVASNHAATRWQHGLLKSDLLLIVAEVLKGVGPASDTLMRAEWNALWQKPGVHALSNGVAHRAAQQIVDSVADRLRLDALRDVAPLQVYYVPQSEMVGAIATELASLHNTTADAEVTGMVRRGAVGELAVWGIAQRYAAAPDFGPAAQSLLGMREVHRALAAQLGISVRELAGANGEPSVDADVTTGQAAALHVARAVRAGVRRAAWGAGPEIRVEYIGDAVSYAAESTLDDLSGHMDFLADAWAQAEAGELEAGELGA